MAVLAGASAADIAKRLAAVAGDVEVTDLRPVETGLVMLRGRTGGNGAPFNLGEATVTRAAVQLATGEKGFAYALGRDPGKARLAAICDALWQNETHRASVEQQIIAPLRDAQKIRRDRALAETAATRVDFFTLVRGEDE
ncbi:MAG: phosphonate C-P lyase system protein PhnG [Pseudolabrys sp.]